MDMATDAVLAAEIMYVGLVVDPNFARPILLKSLGLGM
jgi:hypothetical protein